MFKNVEFTKLRGPALETEFNYFGEQEEVSQAVLSVQANQQFIIFPQFPSHDSFCGICYKISHAHTVCSIRKDRLFPLFLFLSYPKLMEQPSLNHGIITIII